MLRRYSHGSINENEGKPVSKLERAMDAAMKTGFFKGIDENKSGIYTYDDGWTIAKIYSNHNDVNGLDNRLMIYSFEKNRFLTEEPIRSIIWNKDMKDHVIVEKRMDVDDIMNRYRNFMDRDGIMPADWIYYINPEAVDADGYHVVLTDDGNRDNVNMMNKDGKLRFEHDAHEIEKVGDYFVVDFGKESGKGPIVYDGHGNLIMENCYGLEDIYLEFIDPNETILIYKARCKKGNYYDFYDSDLNMIAEGSDFNIMKNTDESNMLKLSIYGVMGRKSYTFQNIITRDSKLLFESELSTVKGWATDVIEHPDNNELHIDSIERNGKYILFDCVKGELIGDIWYDKIKFVYIEPFKQDVILLSKDKKCNMIIPGNDRSFKFVFDKPVDNIKMYDKIPFLFITKDAQDYILWKNNRMMSVPVDKLYKTDAYETYIYENDEKFDLVNIYNDKTFCELFLNGEKFDACFDAECYYPLMEKDGKLTYINAELFRPAFVQNGGKNIRWFDDADPIDNTKLPYEFNVVEDGVKKTLPERVK